MAIDRTQLYDVENVKIPPSNEPIISKTFLVRSDSRWLSTDFVSMSISSSFFEENPTAAEGPSEGRQSQSFSFSKSSNNHFPTGILPPLEEIINEMEEERSSNEVRTEGTKENEENKNETKNQADI